MDTRKLRLVLAVFTLMVILGGVNGAAAQNDQSINDTGRLAQTDDSTDTDTTSDSDGESGMVGDVLALMLERPMLVLGVLTGFLVAGGALYQRTSSPTSAPGRSDTLLPGHRQHKLMSELDTVTQQIRNRTGDAAQLDTADVQLAFRLLRKARRALRNDDYETARLQIDRIYALYRQSRHGPAG